MEMSGSKGNLGDANVEADETWEIMVECLRKENEELGEAKEGL